MLALGLHDSQIGLIATIYLFSQLVFAFFSGPITDKLGRRKATAIFDFVAWSLPCLIWWQSQNFWFFFAAALLCGTMQITVNSWDCLLIEDAKENQITGINSLVVIAAQLSVLFAPISAVLFSRFTLVPAIRILYLNAFFVMTLKIVILYFWSRETKMGMIRLEESRDKSIFTLAAGYGSILMIILKSRGTIFALCITAMARVVDMINVTFWQVIVSKKLFVPDHFLPFFPVFKSMIAIIFLFLVAPRIAGKLLKHPLFLGFGCYIIGQTLLVLAPADGTVKYIILFISLIFDGFGFACLMMLARSLVAFYVNREERARVYAILNMLVIAVTLPFGWIGGLLSNISRNLPFILNLCILFLGVLITFIYYRKNTGTAGYTM